jgi:hypothetical protein
LCGFIISWKNELKTHQKLENSKKLDFYTSK